MSSRKSADPVKRSRARETIAVHVLSKSDAEIAYDVPEPAIGFSADFNRVVRVTLPDSYYAFRAKEGDWESLRLALTTLQDSVSGYAKGGGRRF
jgi:hypothetical protein